MSAQDSKEAALSARGQELPTLLEPATRARRHTHPLLAIVVAIAVTLGPLLLVLGSPLLNVFGPLDWNSAPTLRTAPRDALFLAVLSACIVGLIWLWLRLYEKRPLWTVGFFGRNAAGKAVRGFLLGAAFVLVPYFVAIAAAGWGTTVPRTVEAAWPSLVAGLAVMAVGWLLQSSTEEVVFRGFLTQAIGLRWGLIAAVVIQALAFSAAHVFMAGSPLEFLGLASVGLLLVGYALLEGGLWGRALFTAPLTGRCRWKRYGPPRTPPSNSRRLSSLCWPSS